LARLTVSREYAEAAHSSAKKSSLSFIVLDCCSCTSRVDSESCPVEAYVMFVVECEWILESLEEGEMFATPPTCITKWALHPVMTIAANLQ
jgi:hypothetical protein